MTAVSSNPLLTTLSLQYGSPEHGLKRPADITHTLGFHLCCPSWLHDLGQLYGLVPGLLGNSASLLEGEDSDLSS